MSLVEVYNVNYVQEKLLPPLLRTPIRLDWLKTLTYPIQSKYNDIYGTQSFVRSFSYAKWSAVTAYTVGNRVRFGISIYECLIANTGIDPSSDDVTWLRIAEDFVGIDERVKFSSQHMVFQYVLNRYLNITYATIPQIYTIKNSIDTNGFYMGDDGDGSYGEMGTGTGAIADQDDFMDDSYSLNQYAFTIYVPIALANTLTSETPDVVPNIAPNREKMVRNVADKYKLAGMTYNVVTY